MSEKARLSPRAEAEITAVLERMEHVSAARRLTAPLAMALEAIGRNPGLGHRDLALAGERYRFWRVAGFPYMLIYSADDGPPSVVRFVHAARDLPVLLVRLSKVADDSVGVAQD